MSLYPYRGVLPRVDASCFVAPTAAIIGDVEVGASSSLWFGAVLRGDVMPIRVGARTSIQDNCVDFARHSRLTINLNTQLLSPILDTLLQDGILIPT